MEATVFFLFAFLAITVICILAYFIKKKKNNLRAFDNKNIVSTPPLKVSQPPLAMNEFEILGEEVDDILSDDPVSQRVPLLDRGGKIIGAKNVKKMERARKPWQPKPEIVCWQKGQRWILGVEIPEEICDNGDLEVTLNSLPLAEDNSREYCWQLTQAFGKISVRSNAKNFKIDLGNEGENYLLFKITGKDMREGRRVKSPSSGSYLVVIPDTWGATDYTADEIQVNVEGYKAYWKIFDNKTKTVFDTPKGKEKIQSNSAKFQLIGSNVIRDMTEDAGLLFGENPPQIKAYDVDDWNEVNSIIIGEIGDDKWRAEVPLQDDAVLQNLPVEVMERQSGRYFLRFYDKDNELIESQVFRFVRGLKSVNIPHLQPFPDFDAKHNAVQVDIIYEEDCVIKPASDSADTISIKSTQDRTTLFIPSSPDYDKTIWYVGHKSGVKVEITILLERVWWCIGTENERPSDWKDQPEMLSKDKFSATSNLALWIRFPTPRWVTKVSIGFQQEQKRYYPVSVLEQIVCIPLREFEIINLHHDNILGVWLEHNGEQYEGKVAISLRPEWVGYGQKKSATAVALMRKGSGKMIINDMSVMEYFKMTPSDVKDFWLRLCNLEEIVEILLHLDIDFLVSGSSPSTKQQLGAVTHALAHVLEKYKPELHSLLKHEGFGGRKVSHDKGRGLHNESN